MRTLSRRLFSNAGMSPTILRVHPVVRDALNSGKAVVALESTIISHGMPYPANAACAQGVEDIVRANGAVPATIAVIGGQLVVGLSQDEIEMLAKGGPAAVRKTSRRDLATVIAGGGLGATTVSGTMIGARAAGIAVFATGGIGGVHRGSEKSGDISADLTELGRTRVAVVCAGVKSILDIARTLEYLETQGVPVITMGADMFPAFYTASSGIPSPMRLDTPLAVARTLWSAEQLALDSGTVIAVPNPSPADAASVGSAIDTALTEAAARGLTGAAITPFLLGRVATLTGGTSLAANVALVRNNAAVGARVAVALAQLRQSGGGSVRHASTSSSSHTFRRRAPARRVVCITQHLSSSRQRHVSTDAAIASEAIAAAERRPSSLRCLPIFVGGAVVDTLLRPAAGVKFVLHTSNPGVSSSSFGGAARNMAEVSARLGVPATLYTALGTKQPTREPISSATACDATGDCIDTPVDGLGAALLAHASSVGVHIRTARTRSDHATPTATYTAMLDENGDLVSAIADMEAFDMLTGDYLNRAGLQPRVVADGSDDIPGFFVVDGNVSADGLAYVATVAASSSSPRHRARDDSDAAHITGAAPLLLDSTSVAKCVRVVDADVLHLVTIAKPNQYEVVEIARAWRSRIGMPSATFDADDDASSVDSAVDGAGARADDSIIDDSTATIVGGKGQHAESGSKKQRKRHHGAAMSRTVEVAPANAFDEDVTFHASPIVVTSSGSVDEEMTADQVNDDESSNVQPDYRTLTAAQTVLAGMVRPAGVAVGFSEAALHTAERTLSRYARAAERATASAERQHETGSSTATEPSQAAAAAVFASAIAEVAREDELRSASATDASKSVHDSSVSYGSSSNCNLFPGALIDGRKHLLVTLGAEGVLWLSAPPAACVEDADMMAALPFFTAAAVIPGFDFALLPAPAAGHAKCTGAGDTFGGALVAALCSGASMAHALERALAAAKIAVQTPAGRSASTVSEALTSAAVSTVVANDVRPVDGTYS